MVRKLLLMILLASGLPVSIGCKDSLLDRSLIFSTHTTLGVEVSASPAESGEPVTLIVGYKRSEGVINPVYHSEGIETADEEQSSSLSTSNNEAKTAASKGRRPRYRDKAYSVIAKFRGDAGTSATGTAEGKVSVAQWFATGEAAMTLASQPGIAGAVTGSAEIEKAISERQVTAKPTGDASLAANIVMAEIYQGLRLLAKDGDIEAAAHVKAMDELGKLAPKEFTGYDRDPNDVLRPKETRFVDGGATFYTYQKYAAALRGSVSVLSDALEQETFQYRPSPEAKPAPATPEQRGTLREILALQQALQMNLAMEMLNQKATDEAVDYYCRVLKN